MLPLAPESRRTPAGYRVKGVPDLQTSAAAYGTVVHNALHTLERSRAEGVPFQECVQKAIESFLWYWNPLNIEALTEPVPADGWLPRQGYSELRAQGVETIRRYAESIEPRPQELLAIEYGFVVPIEGTWDPDTEDVHYLGGSVDRMAVRHFSRVPALEMGDWLDRQGAGAATRNLQLTAYCYASTRPEVWTGFEGEDGFCPERGAELYERFRKLGGRGTRVNSQLEGVRTAGLWTEHMAGGA